MPRLKGAAYIHTSRTIRGFRSCRHFTGISLIPFESGRIGFEKEKIAVREALRRHSGLSQCLAPAARGVSVHDRKTLIGDRNKKGIRKGKI
jgi:hypothetical protein